MRIEWIKEGWIKFDRYHCTDGYIDVYTGPKNHHPSLEEKPNIKLKELNTWYRVKGSNEWIEQSQLTRDTLKLSNAHLFEMHQIIVKKK